MNLTWHIIKKDLLRLRLPVLPWVIILAGQVYVSNELLSPLSLDMDLFFEMGMFFNLLVVVGLMLTSLLVAMLVLEDPLSGTTMFWVTRPISGGRLLGTKVVVAFLLFGLLPLLAWLPWWLYCSFGWHDLVRAAGFVLGIQAIAVIPAFALAALVDQIGRFFLYCLMLGFAVLVAFLQVASHTGISREMLLSRLLVVAGLLLLSCLMALGLQYLTRRMVSAAAVVIGGVALSVAVAFWWPVNLSGYWADYRQPLAGAEQITGGIEWADMSSYKDKQGIEVETVVIHLRFTGGLEEICLAGGMADVELRWPDGEKIRQHGLKLTENFGYGPAFSGGSYFFETAPLYFWDIAAVRRSLDLKPDETRFLHHWDPATRTKHTELVAESRERAKRTGAHFHEPTDDQTVYANLYVTVSLTPTQAARVRTDPPACSISARIGARKPAVMLELPLQSGVKMARNGGRQHVLGINRTHRIEKQVLVRPDWINATVVTATAPGYSNDVYIYRVDRTHGSLDFMSSNAAIVALPMAANIACLPFGFPPPSLWRGDKWVEEPGWQDDATLAAVSLVDVGGFDRDFHTDRLAVAKSGSPESLK